MRNKKKIIRTVTVPNSIDLFEDVVVTLKREGYEPEVVTSPGLLLDEFRDKQKDIKTFAVSMERHISLKRDIISLWNMILFFAKERPYVVHSMTPKAGLISMIAACLTRVPVRIHTFTGLVWPTAIGAKRKILIATDKILCACATHIIPEGEGVKFDLETSGVCKRPMRVLGYGNVRGVDMNLFNPQRFNIVKDDVFTYTFVGRIVGDKGINELVEAFIWLHDKYRRTRLVLVGRYEEGLDPVKENTIKRINLEKDIILVGQIFGDRLIEELAKSDCFVMPSYREGFPNTVLEAGAMGLPQIVTDVNGSREIITGDESRIKRNNQELSIRSNGIVIPSRSVDSLYEAMELMLTDDKMRNIMAANARKMIEDRFEKSFVQNCQIQFYKEILQ